MHPEKAAISTFIRFLIFLCLGYQSLVFSNPVCAQQSDTASSAKSETAAAKKEGGVVTKLLKKLSGDAKKAKAEKKKLKSLEKASKDSLQVFGWHASWMGQSFQDYNYNLLTTLSYYACTMTLEEDTVLHYRTPNWTKSSVSQLIKLAEGDECNVLLTLKSKDEEAIKLLLDDSLAQAQNLSILFNLTDTLQRINGVNIMFDALPLSHSGQLTAYVKQLSEALKKEGKILVMSLPAIDYGNKYDIQSLNKYVDRFVVMGYNYYDQKSPKAGPVAPLEGDRKWGRFHIKRSVNDYLKAGLPKNKFILALPYYGAVWEVDTLKSGKVKYNFHNHWRYHQIMEKADKNKIQYDSVSHSAHVVIRKGSRTYHCYFDNEKSLKKKIRWVKQQKLAGIGIWALGYDKGHKELWKTIDDHIKVEKNPATIYEVDTTSSTTAAAAAKAKDSAAVAAASDTAQVSLDGAKAKAEELAQSFLDKYKGVLTNHKVLMIAGITLLVFVVLGVLRSLFFEAVYQKLLIVEWKTYFKISVGFLLVFSALLITLKMIFEDTIIMDEIGEMGGDTSASLYVSVRNYILIIGFVCWVLIQALSLKLFFKFNKDLP